MPNWCMNTFDVYGEEEYVRKFYEENRVEEDDEDNDIQKTELSFRNSVPFSKGHWDYNEAVQIWGTKWDAGEVDVDIGDEQLTYRFQTAWGPPKEWLEKVAKKYPELQFELYYEEPGMDFLGRVEFENGELTGEMQDEYTSYHMRENGLYKVSRIIIQKLFDSDLVSNVMDILNEKIDLDNVYDFESFMEMNNDDVHPYFVEHIQSNPIKHNAFDEISELFDDLESTEHKWMISSHIKDMLCEKMEPIRNLIQKLYQRVKMNQIRKQIHQQKSKNMIQKIKEYGFLPSDIGREMIQNFTIQKTDTIFLKGGPLFHEVNNSFSL